MRVKLLVEDFIVSEVLAVSPAQGGRYALYRARKRALTTLELEHRLAAALGLPLSAVTFPALKDRQAIAVQFGTVRGAGPRHVSGAGFTAERVGWLERPLSPRDVAGNHFAVTLRDLASDEVTRVAARLDELARWGLPNYFDDQRFGSQLADGSFPGRAILQRDEAEALRAYLAGPQAGDPPPVRAFKAFAADHWGDWPALFDQAPRPSNYRSVLTFLRDHPDDYRRALNLIPPRVLSLYLSAYQSFLWNCLAGRYLQARLQERGAPLAALQISGEALPVYRQLPPDLLASLAGVELPMLHHRVQFDEPPVAALAQALLREEGLQLRDLKARVLKRAYLSKGTRALLLRPQDVACEPPQADECFPDRLKLTARFFLPRGSYATLLLKAIEETATLSTDDPASL